MIAKLENLGPFVFFFTLSCADMRWDENVSSILRNKHTKISYSENKDTKQLDVLVHVLDQQGQEIKCLKLEDYLKSEYCSVSKHEQIRRNVLSATRNFDHRVKAFVKHIMKGPDNPMNVEYYNYRVEFQDRGAGHIHGVLWLNFEDMAGSINLKPKLIQNAFEKFRKAEEELSNDETEEMSKFVDKFICCSTNPEDIKKLLYRVDENDRQKVAENVSNIVEDVNTHHHTKSCRKHNTKCRFNFPKLPSKRTILTQPMSQYNCEKVVLDENERLVIGHDNQPKMRPCLLYTSDAADE